MRDSAHEGKRCLPPAVGREVKDGTIRTAMPLLLLLSACDAYFRIDATVVDGAGHPVVGARMTASCLPNADYRSDASGRVQVHELGRIDDGCELRVEKPGYRSHVFGSDGACTARNTIFVGGCREIKTRIALSP